PPPPLEHLARSIEDVDEVFPDGSTCSGRGFLQQRIAHGSGSGRGEVEAPLRSASATSLCIALSRCQPHVIPSHHYCQMACTLHLRLLPRPWSEHHAQS